MTILQTPRLILRHFVPEDATALARVLSDPETMRYYPAPLDQAGVERWIARNLERYKTDGVGLWAIELKWKAVEMDPRKTVSLPHELIGDCGVIQQEVDGDMFYEIGYHLRRDQWGRGYATEAARACRNWAFEHLRAERVISLIRPDNVRSRHVAERNGMTIWKEVDWRGMIHCVFSVQRKEILPYKMNAE
jgi:[ribosomal protein S5]-alanine N-acetyltransferase